MTSFLKLFRGSSGNSKVKSSDLIEQFPKNLNFTKLCSEALRESQAGKLPQLKLELGPLLWNLDFFSGERGYQISWMLEPGKETPEIPEGKILQFEISRPGQEALKMTYDPSKNYNAGSFPLIQHLPLNASLKVKLINKPSSEQEDQDNRSVGRELSKAA